MRAKISVVVALALVGCGSGIGSKQDAAGAMQRLSVASSSASVGAQQSPLTSKLKAGGTATVSGKSGSATVTYNGTVTDGGLSSTMSFHVVYAGYSADGKNTFDGTEDFSTKTAISVNPGSVSADVEMAMQGSVTMKGDYDSKVDFNIKSTASAASLSASGGQVAVKLDGTVTADGQTYTFNNETLTVDASK